MTILCFGGTEYYALEEEKAGGWGDGQEVREVPRWKRKKKKLSAGRRGEERREGRKERKDETSEKERDLVRREKADTADVAGERNAAGISGRKLGGRVRRRGSGTKGGPAHGTGGGGGVKGGLGGSGRRDGEGGRCFRHLKPAVGGTDPL